LPAAHPSKLAEKNLPNNHSNSNSPIATTTTKNYAEELLSIKREISNLKTLITTAVEQFKMAIESLTATPCSVMTSEMDTEEQSTTPHNPTPTSPDLSAIINDLKHELAAFVNETRTLLQQEKPVVIPFQLTPFPT